MHICMLSVWLYVEFADELKTARKLRNFKQYMVGRGSETTFAEAFEKQEAIIRVLGGYDPTGEVIKVFFFCSECIICSFLRLLNVFFKTIMLWVYYHCRLNIWLIWVSFQNIQPSQKQEAAKKCNCTIADVENTLAKFTWAKEAQKKIEKMKEEGKPMPKSLAEVLLSSLKNHFSLTILWNVVDEYDGSLLMMLARHVDIKPGFVL